MKIYSVDEYISLVIEAWENKHKRQTTQEERDYLRKTSKFLLLQELNMSHMSFR